jgi:glycerol-3-phosphate acyltransferase PlsY
MAVLCAGVIFVALAAWRKLVSLASIAAAVTIPVYLFFTTNSIPLPAASVVAAWLIVYGHRQNIYRIWNGTEPRITDLKR